MESQNSPSLFSIGNNCEILLNASSKIENICPGKNDVRNGSSAKPFSVEVVAELESPYRKEIKP